MNVKHILFGEDVIDVNVDNSAHGDAAVSSRMAIVNPTLTFTPQFIPSTFSFSALIMIQGMPEKETEIKLEFQNKTNSKIIFSVKSLIPVSIPRNPKVPPHLAGLNMNVPLRNIPLENEGEYELKVYLNDVLSASELITIIKNS